MLQPTRCMKAIFFFNMVGHVSKHDLQYNHATLRLFKMFGAMHFIYYTNRSIATKVDSNIWAVDQQHNSTQQHTTAHSVYVL